MTEGEANRNGMILKKRTSKKSSTHPNAYVWIMECCACGNEADVNSCDAHERLCPTCNPAAAPSR